MVIASRNTVHSVLFLILDFISISCLFIMIGAEFLGMMMLIVYVGAVAVLFVFVVMLMNVSEQKLSWFRGSKKSRRFYTALKVDRVMVQNVISTADGTAWRWGHGRTDIQVIGSYTRSGRCVIDPEKSKDALRASIFWSYINRHS